MNKILFQNIKQLAGILPASVTNLIGKELNTIQTIDNAWLLVVDDKIEDFGGLESITDAHKKDAQIVDCTDRLVLPAFVDSHTHLVYAGTREDEFKMRLNGATYEEIAEGGGGILNSAKKLQNTSEEDLYIAAKKRLDEVIALGTGAIEIKSGYGLTKESELKMLRVIQRLKKESNAIIKSSFLGAHAVPVEFKNNADGYLNMLIEDILPTIVENQLADYVDIFCEKGYFSAEQTNTLLQKAMALGLKSKIHVNQFNAIGGIEVAVKNNAISVDHLEVMDDIDYTFLKDSKTIATLLPLCSFFINIPYAPARKLVNNNSIIALATDYNPGSTPCGNMQLVQSAACINMKLTPIEAFNASTINAAAAIEQSNLLGSITKGKRANLLVTKKIPSLEYISYNFGHNHIETVFLGGVQQ